MFPWMKKSSKGNILLMWKRGNRETAGALKGVKTDKLKSCPEQWEDVLAGVPVKRTVL